MTLEADSHPAVRFIERLVGAGCNSVCKGKEGALRSDLLVQTLDQQIVLMVQHLTQALTTDETRTLPVDRI